jgi:hypothetical protein
MSLPPRISKIYLKLNFYSALAEAKESGLAQTENFGGCGLDGLMY